MPRLQSLHLYTGRIFGQQRGGGNIWCPPFYKKHPDEETSQILYQKFTEAGGTADRNNIRLIIPARDAHNSSAVAYVTYCWISVYVQHELSLDELPAEVPKGFEEFKNEILSFGANAADDEKTPDEGKMGLYVVYTSGSRGFYLPQEMHGRGILPQRCSKCDAGFDNPTSAYFDLQEHRIKVHNSKEGGNPLPNA
ncbi:hypothetical protein PT974_05121 [Cladobotryum mycophilum]|uniref:C2H2-type domain-containing protein n=1 Tax=Cladobotryum mycophilum TaxID=491253 RepID=A0ABR0SRH2_9HYPO